jgi:ribulose-phosphate 3-epimerase
MRLAPSILSFDLTNLKAEIASIDALNPDVIHLDVMDGQFVPPISFGASFVKSLRPSSTSKFEVHLMTNTPERQFQDFVDAGCSRVIFHAEATAHAHRLAQQLRGMGAEASMAINPGTPVECAIAMAGELDAVLIMTVNPGWGGQTFLEFTLDKIRRLRAAWPNLTIEVDGGIDPETIGRARDAGANLFVVGSYLANAKDLGVASERLREAAG